MKDGENRFRNKETVESKSDDKSSSKSQDSRTFYDRMKNGMGVAAAGAAKVAGTALKITAGALAVQAGLGMIGRVEGVTTAPRNGTALAKVDNHTTNASVPGLEMKQLSNHTQYTELASILRNVTPDTIKHLENVGVPKEEMQCIQAENTPKKKGGFARREHIKRLYEANRRLLQSCETNCTAYTPCLPENVSCHEERACADPDGRGYKTWWNFDYCSDLNNGQHCPSYEGSPSDTGTRC